MGGAVAEKGAWLQLEALWNGLLSEFGLSSYHSADFSKPHGYDETWGKQRVALFCDKLTASLQSKVAFVTWYAVERRLFESVSRQFPHLPMEPYDILVEMCIADMFQFAHSSNEIAPIGLFFEAGQPMSAPLFKHFRSALASRAAQEANKIRSLVILPKEDCFAFQVADFVAYEGYKRHDNRLDSDKRAMRKSLESLTRRTNLVSFLINDKLLYKWFQNIETCVGST